MKAFSRAGALLPALPIEIVTAAMEIAARATATGLVKDVAAIDGNVKREKLDVIETEFFAPGDRVQGSRPVWGVVDGLLAQIITGKPGNIGSRPASWEWL